jgi:hypothetical protein
VAKSGSFADLLRRLALARELVDARASRLGCPLPFRCCRFLRVVALLVAAGCTSQSVSTGEKPGAAGADGSGDGVDLTGEFTVDLTNGSNDCPSMSDWTEGSVTSGVQLRVTQNGQKLDGELMGAAGLYLVSLTGTSEFAGQLSGGDFTLTDRGPKAYDANGCKYTIDAVIRGSLAGDAISGTVTFKPVIDKSAACAPYACEAVQTFSGARPKAK